MKFKTFSNELALQIGLKIIELAKDRNQVVGVLISRLNTNILTILMDGMTEDKLHWLTRKCNTVKRFEVSTLELNDKLIKDQADMYDKYGLDKSDYVAVAGAIPVESDSGLVAVIAVTGLKPEEDHQDR